MMDPPPRGSASWKWNLNCQEFVPSSKAPEPSALDHGDEDRAVAAAAASAPPFREEVVLPDNLDNCLPDDLTDAFDNTLGIDAEGDASESGGAGITGIAGNAVGYAGVEGEGGGYFEEPPAAKYPPGTVFLKGPNWRAHSYLTGPDGKPMDPSRQQTLNSTIAFLCNEFPGYSFESLHEVLKANDYNVSLTIDVLTQLDIESGSLGLHNGAPTLVSQVAPALNDLNFPSLGTASASSGKKKKKYQSVSKP